MSVVLHHIPLPKSRNQPLYLDLKAELAAMLREGRLQPGDRFFSHRQVAEASGVSRITAQMAIKELIRDGLLTQEPHRGAVVRQVPVDGEAVSRWSVGLVLSQWDEEGALAWNDARIVPVMLERAAAKGVSLQMIPHAEAVGRPDVFDRRVTEAGFNGLIWISMRAPSAVTAARWGDQNVVQLAVQGRPTNLELPMVVEGNREAAAQALSALVDEGHRRVLVIHGDPGACTYRERVSAVSDGLAERGLSWGDECFLELPEAPHPAWVTLAIRDALERVKPTAVLHLCDGLLHVASAAEQAGLRCGVDLDVVSFVPPEALPRPVAFAYRYLAPRLREIGAKTIDLWLECRDAHQTGDAGWRRRVAVVPMDFNRFDPDD